MLNEILTLRAKDDNRIIEDFYAMATRLGTVKDAAQQAYKARQEIKKGNFTPFIPALVMALIKDGMLDFIPIVGNALGLFITVYLFIFLWGKGKWKVRLVIFLLSVFDVIPAVNFIPFSTICVAYAFLQAKRDAEKAKVDLDNQSAQTKADRIRDYQMSRAVAIRETQIEESQSGAQNSPEAERSQTAPRMMNDMKQAVPRAEVGANNNAQKPAVMAPTLASNDPNYAGNKQPDWMRDKSVDESMSKRNERSAVAQRLGMDKGAASKQILDLEESERKRKSL